MMPPLSRRNVLVSGLASLTAGAAGLFAGRPGRAQSTDHATRGGGGRAGRVVTPDVSSLPWRWEDGRKTFHLIAEPVVREFAPGLRVSCWGYNGETPGPTIEAVEGDHLRIYVENRLPEPTSVHWHGVLLPNGMDGVAGLNQRRIEPGETFKYEFQVRQHGTSMYHPHFDEMVQQSMGMMGFLIFHPRQPRRRIDRDFAIFLNEWFIKPGTSIPDPTMMLDFNVFTFNGRVFPGTAPLVVRHGDRVRIRIANISMDSHPIHLHGHHFRWTGTDAGPLPETAWTPETSINVPPGTTRDVELVADNPGDWALHCHKVHHTMNQMGHDLPIMTGVDQSGVAEKIEALVPGYMAMGTTGMGDMAHEAHGGAPRNTLLMGGGQGPFGEIFMGGMFTIFKVREGLLSYDADPGWYQHPPGTVAEAIGPRQAVAPTATMPRRRVPLPVDPHGGQVGGGAAAEPSCGSGVARAVDFQAVKAASCAAARPRR
jgi:hypothetical protein